MSDDPNAPKGFTPPTVGPAQPGAEQPQPGFTPPAEQPQPGFTPPTQQPHPGFTQPGFTQPTQQPQPGFTQPTQQPQPGFMQPAQPSGPPGGFGVNLPPGVSPEIYEREQQSSGSGHGLASASLVLGICSLLLGMCCGIFTIILGLGGVACGLIALNQRPTSSDRTMAIIGVSLSGLSVVLFAGLMLLGFGMALIGP